MYSKKNEREKLHCNFFWKKVEKKMIKLDISILNEHTPEIKRLDIDSYL